MKLEDQNILIVSNEPWGDFWYSKHNYANELSKKNKVYFLNPPRSFADNLFKSKITSEIVSPNLTVLEYANVLPVSLLNFWKLNDIIVLKRLKKFFQEKGIANVIFWTFDPIRLAFPELLKPKQIVLHIVDEYLFQYRSETILAKKAHHIICVSESIAGNYKKFNSTILIQPHAIPDDEFLPIKNNRNNPLQGVFVGKIDGRINVEFNITVFKNFPAINFLIIGSTTNKFTDRIKEEQLNNITILPPVKSVELKYHINRSDFCFIFKKIYSGNNIFSHKLLQYLAQGKPVFGTDFSDIDSGLKKSLYLSNNIEEINKMLVLFCETAEPAQKIEARINYAKQHLFSKTLTAIEDFFTANPNLSVYSYHAAISPKTKLLNLLRKPLVNPFFDKILANCMHTFSGRNSFIGKIVPPEYLYKKSAPRNYNRNGIKMQLNIRNLVDHDIYFSFGHKAIDNFLSNLKTDDTVIDVGANIGHTTLLFSKKCYNGKIISVEPSKKLFEIVKQHLDLNEIKNVIPLNIGLGETSKSAQLFQVNDSNSGMNRVLTSGHVSHQSEGIIIKTLDSVVAELKIRSISAIKIDVEGYEYNILKGASETLKAFKPILLIEIDDYNLKEQNATPGHVFNLLTDIGYSIFNAETLQPVNIGLNYTDRHFDIICFQKK